jgi:hypothetical protein
MQENQRTCPATIRAKTRLDPRQQRVDREWEFQRIVPATIR